MRNFMGILMLTGLLLCLLAGSSHADDSHLQYFYEEDQLILYIPGLPESTAGGSGVQLQIGAETVLDAILHSVGETGGAGIHTFLLVDNSLSIAEENRDRMIQMVHMLLDGHQDGEWFTLAVYDRQMQTLASKSEDYSYLHQLADEITYRNQESYLKDVLYEAYLQASREPGVFTRFIVFSDGCDDHATGYTSAEIRELFEKQAYPVYAVGSRFEADPGALEDLFALARMTGGACMLLDETGDPGIFMAALDAEVPSTTATFQIPVALQDGSFRNVRLHIAMEGEERTIISELHMPFAVLPPVDAADTSPETDSYTEDAMSDVPDRPVPEDEEPGEFQEETGEFLPEETGGYDEGPWPELFYEEGSEEWPDIPEEPDVPEELELLYQPENPDAPEELDLSVRDYQNPETDLAAEASRKDLLLFAVGGGIILAALAVLVYRGWSRRKNQRENTNHADARQEDVHEDYQKGLVGKVRAMSNTDEDAPTVLLHGTANATDLLQQEGSDVVILIPDGDYTRKVECPCTRQITIGRRTDCDICMRDDTAVSGLHCSIFYNRRGELSVRDHHSSNGTFLNDVRIQEEKVLKTGDILEVGRTRYHVQVRQGTPA